MVIFDYCLEIVFDVIIWDFFFIVEERGCICYCFDKFGFLFLFI